MQKSAELAQAPKIEELSSQFSDILNYATNPMDQETMGEKCTAIRTHGVLSIETASAEMNAVALQNTRVAEPVYHFILSWPEHEKPPAADVFDAAEHALRALGLQDHQYVIAIHGNTDNLHCHIAVNRVNPFTFASTHIEWAQKSLHRAARESEIKHGWSHDNGLYVVQVDGEGVKRVVENIGYSKTGNDNYAHRGEFGEHEVLPAWHDPDSLDSWLKGPIARELKKALPNLDSWQALHAWLDRHYIDLKDTGGGGLRLHATSYETGEILEIPASKGLRLLKRADLEKRWGPFAEPVTVPFDAPDFSPFTIDEINEGVEDVDNRVQGIPDDLPRFETGTGSSETFRGGSLHEVSRGDLDGPRQEGGLSLPHFGSDDLEDGRAGEDPNLRLSVPGSGGSGGQEEEEPRVGRDYAKRALRREERAEARADLRRRFSLYRQLVRGGSDEYFKQSKAIKGERSDALQQLRVETEAARRAVPKGQPTEVRLHSQVAIDTESTRRKLDIEARFQEQAAALRARRTLPLGWREWLHMQAGQGDQAALAALRGIVYQAQRDAKRAFEASDAEIEGEGAKDPEVLFKRAMARLLEEEKREVAIRSGNVRSMRAYEADALLVKYADVHWSVTGNGNIEYRWADGAHLFTDRGNRLTFDRVLVTDDDIRLALLHAQQKFGRQLTLTGDDPVFSARMARLADDLGIVVLNPELQPVILTHRAERAKGLVDIATMSPTLNAAKQLAERQGLQPPVRETSEARLRAEVLSIDPRATFADMDTHGVEYVGPLVAMQMEEGGGFAQHLGRSVYALHSFAAPTVPPGTILRISYAAGNAEVSIPVQDKGRDL